MGTPVQRRRRGARAAIAVLAVAAAVHVNASRAPASGVPAQADDRTIIHVLNRIGFGPRPGDIAFTARPIFSQRNQRMAMIEWRGFVAAWDGHIAPDHSPATSNP